MFSYLMKTSIEKVFFFNLRHETFFVKSKPVFWRPFWNGILLFLLFLLLINGCLRGIQIWWEFRTKRPTEKYCSCFGVSGPLPPCELTGVKSSMRTSVFDRRWGGGWNRLCRFLNFHQIFHRFTLNFAFSIYESLKYCVWKYENMKTPNLSRCSLAPHLK